MGAPDMDELSFTDSELNFHVRNALKAATQGDCDFYNQLVAVMHHKEHLSADEVALLVTCLKAVNGAVSCIDTLHHRSLLAAIFGMSLWDYETDVMDALVELIVSLASSNGEYVDLCFEMLVKNFIPPIYFRGLLKHPRALSKKAQVLDRVHSSFKDISDVLPLSPLRLEKIVLDRMPIIFVKEEFTVIYVENMLRLESGAMGGLMGSTILAALINRLLELDVEIPWEDILQDDPQKGIFDMELEPADMDQDWDESTREAIMERYCGVIKTHAEKLDSLMVLTFEHLNSCSEIGRLVQVFEILLQSFQKTVLTAYKSKFTQFVMFYACSLDPENCGKTFAYALVDIFLNGVNPGLRMIAVAYLASYLARAKFIQISLVTSILERVVDWCFKYCKNLDSDINPKAHKVFYAGCQATLYVLCFRMKQMLAVPWLKSQLQLMRIKDILGHPLNPLEVCLPSIVGEFRRLVKANGIFSLPETFVNHGIRESKYSVEFGGIERLHMFFPFDPCLLGKCDRYIRSNYVYWSMVRNSYEEDDDEGMSNEDFDSGDELNIPDDIGEKSYDDDDDDFDCSFDKMSITPRNSSHKFGGRMQRFAQMPSKIRPSTSPESL